MIYSLLENNSASLIIKKEEKDMYMQILGEAQINEYSLVQILEKLWNLQNQLWKKRKREYLYLLTKVRNKLQKFRKQKRKKKDVSG